MIRLRGVVCSFGQERVLTGVNLDVSRGELALITGEAGCGKTTLLRTIAALLPADSGTVEIDGRALTSIDGAVGKVAIADGWLAPGDELTTSEYFELATGRRDAGILARVGLGSTTRISRLPADARRRLSVACALGSRRDVILLDTPVDIAFLDLIDDARRAGSAVVATSDAIDPYALDARVWQLRQGRLEPALMPVRKLAGAAR